MLDQSTRAQLPPPEPSDVEEWRAIAGYAGRYEISSYGRVRSHWFKQPRMLRPGQSGYGDHPGDGYLYVGLYENSISTMRQVSHLVAEAFIGPRPPTHQVNHIDGHKRNNRPKNLEYVTQHGNIQHAVQNGLHGQVKLTPVQVREIRGLRGTMSLKKIAALYGVSYSNVSHIHTGRSWSHLPD